MKIEAKVNEEGKICLKLLNLFLILAKEVFMKNTYFTIILLSLINTNIFSQWIQISSGTNTSFYAVKFFNSNTGVIAGQDTVGKIFRTVNGGMNWTLVHRTEFNEMFECLYFVNDQTGWSGTYSGKIFKTINSGVNWTQVSSAPIGRIKSIHFIDSQSGWIVGTIGNGRSLDGGNSWMVSSASGKSVHLHDFNTALIAKGSIERTTNSGLSYDIVYSPPLYYGINDLHFLNSQTGFAGGTRKLLVKTTDGGLTWNEVAMDTVDNFHKIFFLDENLGYAVGQRIYGGMGWTVSYGIFMKTINGGINWTTIPVDYNIDAYEDIGIVDAQTGYMVGHRNRIYKSTTAGYVGVSNVNLHIPNSFSLSQNYPNPFNPVTKIKFDITQNGFTELTIYDVLGRIVNKLVSETLNAGSYEASFNAFDIPSGIYFYKLISNDFTQTKKMILLK